MKQQTGDRSVSPQTIYTWIKQDPHREHWEACLRRRGKRPCRRKNTVLTGDAARICNRPKVIEQRLRLGDFEDDTVLGPAGTGGLATLVFRSRLVWNQPGTVWAADFKERREPIEGRYGWILSIKDLASRCQLLWQPLVDASAAVVRELYARLFTAYGPPLVMKSDNGGQFRADEIKALLAQFQVIPLFSPKRHPRYNGSEERANGQLTSYRLRHLTISVLP